MRVEHRRQTHPLHLFQQQRDVVDALGEDVRYLIHPQSLAQSGMYLQIWANREYYLKKSHRVFPLCRPYSGKPAFSVWRNRSSSDAESTLSRKL